MKIDKNEKTMRIQNLACDFRHFEPFVNFTGHWAISVEISFLYIVLLETSTHFSPNSLSCSHGIPLPLPMSWCSVVSIV